MSRFKFLVLFLVLAMTLLWPETAVAEDPNPNTCLPTCYAYNYPFNQVPSGVDGTEQLPWYWDKQDDPYADQLRDLVEGSVRGRRNFGALQVIDCTDADPPECTATLYVYDRGGNETSQSLGEVPIPDVGVLFPVPYILGGGTLLGVLLIGAGIVLRRRAVHWRS